MLKINITTDRIDRAAVCGRAQNRLLKHKISKQKPCPISVLPKLSVIVKHHI